MKRSNLDFYTSSPEINNSAGKYFKPHDESATLKQNLIQIMN